MSDTPTHIWVDAHITFCPEDAFLLVHALSQTDMNLHELATLAVHQFIRRQIDARTPTA